MGGSGGSGGQGGKAMQTCNLGPGTADFWLDGGTKTCVRNNAGYNVSLIPTGVQCAVPMVVLSMSIVPTNASNAVHDLNGNIISMPSPCLNKSLGPTESCGVQLGQLDRAIGTKSALVVCAADAEGKVLACTTFPPC